MQSNSVNGTDQHIQRPEVLETEALRDSHLAGETGLCVSLGRNWLPTSSHQTWMQFWDSLARVFRSVLTSQRGFTYYVVCWAVSALAHVLPSLWLLFGNVFISPVLGVLGLLPHCWRQMHFWRSLCCQGRLEAVICLYGYSCDDKQLVWILTSQLTGYATAAS